MIPLKIIADDSIIADLLHEIVEYYLRRTNLPFPDWMSLRTWLLFFWRDKPIFFWNDSKLYTSSEEVLVVTSNVRYISISESAQTTVVSH